MTPRPPSYIYVLTILLLSVFLNGCSNVGLALINTRAKLISSAEIVSDIKYGTQQWQRLDLYIPKNKTTSPLPCLIFFYGGSWDSGQKEQYLFAASKFASLGYLVIVPDYIKYPQGKFPSFIEDGAQAVSWLKDNINQYHGDPNNVFVVGHSAGAHLGALLLADASYLKNVGLAPNQIRGFAGLAGPYNFTPKEPRFVRIFEPPTNYPKMKVSNYINGDEPPMLLMHGDNDDLVDVANKDTTIEAINSVGGISKDINYPEASHVGILLAITSPYFGKADPSTEIDKFFRQYLTD